MMITKLEFKSKLLWILCRYKNNNSKVTLETNDSGIWFVYERPYWYLGQFVKPLIGSSSDRAFLENILKEVGVEYEVVIK